MLEQRQRGQVEGRIAKEAEQRAIEQRRLPGSALPAADEDHDAGDIEQIEQDRGRELDLAQHVADLGGEEVLGDDAKEQKIKGDDDEQRHQIERGVSVHAKPSSPGNEGQSFAV